MIAINARGVLRPGTENLLKNTMTPSRPPRVATLSTDSLGNSVLVTAPESLVRNSLMHDRSAIIGTRERPDYLYTPIITVESCMIPLAPEYAELYFDSNHHLICMSRYMTAMATRFFPRMALAAIGPGPGWRRLPKTRSEKLGTFRSYLTLLHFSVALDRENHDANHEFSCHCRSSAALQERDCPANHLYSTNGRKFLLSGYTMHTLYA